MNCFNIREIQTLLKARFYADLLNETDQHLFLSKTAIGLRYKTEGLDFLNPHMLLLNRYGILNSQNSRFGSYISGLPEKASYNIFGTFTSIKLNFINYYLFLELLAPNTLSIYFSSSILHITSFFKESIIFIYACFENFARFFTSLLDFNKGFIFNYREYLLYTKRVLNDTKTFFTTSYLTQDNENFSTNSKLSLTTSEIISRCNISILYNT